jgi:hypothetical protein
MAQVVEDKGCDDEANTKGDLNKTRCDNNKIGIKWQPGWHLG